MLHITNGDSAGGTLLLAGVPGEVLAWKDVLHDGPVPAGLSLGELTLVRAEFLAGGGGDLEAIRGDLEERDRRLEGFRGHEEVVLWFEHDLYDQLQLIQILDWFHRQRLGGTTLSMVVGDAYLGELSAAELAARLPARTTVSDAQLGIGSRAWEAFTAPDPLALDFVFAGHTSPLPFLGAALRRHLEEFPSARNGLGRSENQALRAIAAGARRPADAFARSQAMEEAVFRGDLSFRWLLEGLAAGPEPLLAFDPAPPAGFWAGAIEVTGAGRDVLAGTRDGIEIRGIDRWLGGVHLTGREAAWRWNEMTHRLETPGARPPA
jgi:hypothetical protein